MMPNRHIYRHVPIHCLDCGRILDAATDMAEDHRAPEPGDFSVCLCGCIQAYAPDLGLRRPTDAELIEIAGDPEFIAANNLAGLARKAEEAMRQLRIGEETVHANGVWGGTIAFRCAWAHPFWADYVMLVYDLDTPIPGVTQAAHKENPAATHEFMLYPLQPCGGPGKQNSEVDFAKRPSQQAEILRKILTPGNHGYQFKAANHAAAWARVNALVDACIARQLSPDTDFRSDWDARMKDGWTLHRSALAVMTGKVAR